MKPKLIISALILTTGITFAYGESHPVKIERVNDTTPSVQVETPTPQPTEQVAPTPEVQTPTDTAVLPVPAPADTTVPQPVEAPPATDTDHGVPVSNDGGTTRVCHMSPQAGLVCQ